MSNVDKNSHMNCERLALQQLFAQLCSIPVANSRYRRKHSRARRRPVCRRKGTTFLLASRKILIVEDFEDLRNLVSVFLCAHGYEVLEAPTGRAAIQSAVTGNPDFILLDFRLPDISGLGSRPRIA